MGSLFRSSLGQESTRGTNVVMDLKLTSKQYVHVLGNYAIFNLIFL